MRKLLSILFMLAFVTPAFAQNNPRPSASRFWLNKASTFQIKPGDILVYQVMNNGNVYDFIATVKKYGQSAHLEYNVPEKDLKGQTTINAGPLKSGVKYYNIFTNTESISKDKSTFWLSKDNYRGIAGSSKQTKMDFGNGSQTFVRESISTQKIQYKGKEKIITLYKVATRDTSGREELWVLNDLENPLIVKMDGASTITLKEVR